MSTIAYSMLTRRRAESPRGRSKDESPPGVGRYVDILGALVPAEVLAAHAAIMSFTTKTETNQAGEVVTTITEPETLVWVFAALIVVSMVLYLAPFVGHWADWDWPDVGRMLIPPFAFVGWTMLQTPTAFDAVAPGLPMAPRFAIAVIGAILLAMAAGVLAERADQSDPVARSLARAAGQNRQHPQAG